ncbi:hypothetical protein ACFC00_15715 [Streptomyces adustus]|uniref:hypothetical protein n=1 Tax=Streptomyces adustus TaxID=1609272 RepID=UPI0035E24A87
MAPLTPMVVRGIRRIGQKRMPLPSAESDRLPADPDPARRRRGPGRLVVRTLVGIAAGRGAAAGVPVVTPEGRALYERAGWRVVVTPSGAVRNWGPLDTSSRF